LGGMKNVSGGFDSHALPPDKQVNIHRKALTHDSLVNAFLNSRRKGTSPRTIDFYEGYLRRSTRVIGTNVTGPDIARFLDTLGCSNGGKHTYYDVLRVFYRWLYSPRSGYGLDLQLNPITWVEPPKVDKRILPSLTVEQVDFLIKQAGCERDKAIVSLFADTGLRLSELANIDPDNIDWEHRLIKVTCKGNREGLALFGKRTEKLLSRWLSKYRANGRLWDLHFWGIKYMLGRLAAKTGLPCNPHTFRRTFASILAKRGVDALHIKRLGRWESMVMVEHYTRSVKFEDSMRFYTAIVS
jgi:site-specific recombinase XerD